MIPHNINGDPDGFNSNIGKSIYNRLKEQGKTFEDSLYREEWESEMTKWQK